MSSKKLKTKELKKLQEAVNRLNTINQKRAQLCLAKEVEIRKTNDQFEENWEMLTMNSDQALRDQTNLLSELAIKYGKEKMFDLTTGDIKKPE